MTYNKHLLCAVRMLRFCKWFHQRLPAVSIWFLVFRDETLGQINWAMRKWELGFWWLGHSIMEISLWVKSSLFILDSSVIKMQCFVLFFSQSKDDYSDAWLVYFKMFIFDDLSERLGMEEKPSKAMNCLCFHWGIISKHMETQIRVILEGLRKRLFMKV